jgi:threonine aldolase
MSHVAFDECGAAEKVGGFKLLEAPSDGGGKLTVESISRFTSYEGSIHQAQPKVLSLTQPTELGTLYTPDEMKKLVAFAKKRGWFVHVDGARLGNAVVAQDVDFRAYGPEAGVDAVTLGGTKSGFAFGEAVVLFRKKHADAARFLSKAMPPARVENAARRRAVLALSRARSLEDDRRSFPSDGGEARGGLEGERVRAGGTAGRERDLREASAHVG